ncbi:MAG: SMP-30/gluconolactonase/LRE family protein, partial [Microvirga sp.]
MSQHKVRDAESATLSRRTVIGALGAGIAVAGSGASLAQPVAPPTTITNPPRDFSRRGAPTTYFTDPDILSVDPVFDGIAQPNSAIQRLWTGALWSEGPAWNAVGRYLVWSDIPNNRQLRWIEDDGRVSVFRMPSNNSNGNTFDFQGRQVTCEHTGRRISRYEHDGSITAVAETYMGQRLNSPNDVAPHRDGSYWFTDPPPGFTLYEGAPEASGGTTNPEGRYNSRAGQPLGVGTAKREITTANVFRVDPQSGRVDMMVSGANLPGIPNGIAFSPDYRKLYLVTNGIVHSFDLSAENKLSNQKEFTNFMVDGIQCRTDGIRVDVNGNLWCGSNAGRNVGYSGVTVWSPEAKLLGRIRL